MIIYLGAPNVFVPVWFVQKVECRQDFYDTCDLKIWSRSPKSNHLLKSSYDVYVPVWSTGHRI